MDFQYFIMLAAVGFFASLILFIVGKKIAPLVGLTDAPDIITGGRKNHEGSIPLIGGLVIIPVYTILVLYAGVQELLPLYWLMPAVILLLIVGVVDDRFHIMPWVRFIIQIWVAAFVVVECGAELTNLGNLFGFGAIEMGWFGKIFAVTCLVLLMNAINILDGVDLFVRRFLKPPRAGGAGAVGQGRLR